MKHFSRLPYHSILVGLYPIVYLYAHNMMVIPPGDTVRSLLVSAGLAAFFLLSFRVILKGWEKAGVLCSLLMVLLFTFGHVANALEKALASPKSASLNLSTLAWVALILFLALSFLMIRYRLPAQATLFLNVTGLALMIFPLTTILVNRVSLRDTGGEHSDTILAEIRGEAEAEASMVKRSADELPDIYYIVLDSYERADMLEEHYGFDNSLFVDALDRRGFYVASNSRSNYLNTTYSLNTALNLIYFGDFPPDVLKNARYNLQTNYVSDFLREQGYQIVVFDSGTGDTNNQYADVFVSPGSNTPRKKPLFNAFESLLLRTTIGRLLFASEPQDDDAGQVDAVLAASIDQELDVRRERITHALSHLPDFAAQDGPHFSFAHIYLPHMPFLYGPDGEALKYHQNPNFYWYQPEPEHYVDQYVDQIEYLNRAVLETIDRILAASETPVVIILQSDHGDDHYLDWFDPSDQGVDIRSATLNAIYFSDGSYETLYPNMTTVNTFRLVLNHWFGTTYPLLEEKVFFHKHFLSTPPNAAPVFLDGCADFDLCLPPPPELPGS